MPIGAKRFEHYLQKLQGSYKNALEAAIMGYNPMAKDHALHKINMLQKLNAESIATDIIDSINTNCPIDQNFKVIINLADDLHGAWSEKHTTEFDCTFRFEGTFNKGFCTPYFWTSEDLSESIIVQRIKEAIYRTLFWVENKGEKNLDYFFKQEMYVSKHTNNRLSVFDESSFRDLEKFLKTHQSEIDYSILFNFFFGDRVSEILGYSTYGITSFTGFELARIHAQQS